MSSALSGPALSRASILVVDDEGLVRLIVAEELRDQDYCVLEAASVDAAAKMLRDGSQVDLFTDVRMPWTLDGIALARLVHSEFPRIKVIIASGHVSAPPLGFGGRLFLKTI